MSTKQVDGNQVVTQPQEGWFDRHQRKISYTLLITGLALTMIALGAIATLATVPHHHFYHYPRSLPNDQYHTIYDTIETSAPISGIITMAPLTIGIVFLVLGSSFLIHKRRQEKKNQIAQVAPEPQDIGKEAIRQRVKNIALVVGFVLACAGIGMIVASSFIMHGALHDAKDLMAHGPKDTPGSQWFWDELKTKWIDPTQSHMNITLSVGILTAISAVGLSLVTGGASSIRDYFRERNKTKSEENVVVTTGGDL